MKYDQFGQAYCSERDLVEILYKNPNADLSRFLVDGEYKYNQSVQKYYENYPLLKSYESLDVSDISEFDCVLQKRWRMPDEYKDLDITSWILDQCQSQEELQRVGQELLMFQERDMMDLLRYLKYFVDTMRKNNVVWGLGRGSSVASYVLYLIGVHKINSMYFDLDISEFLR